MQINGAMEVILNKEYRLGNKINMAVKNSGLKEDIDSSIPFSDFLESTPSSRITLISDLVKPIQKRDHVVWKLNRPEIQIHCTHDLCNGPRFYRCKNSNSFITVWADRYANIFLEYQCSNCQTNNKTFSLSLIKDVDDEESGHCFKYGEKPVFGPPTAARLITLIGGDRESFLKGRRCENQGLGIGAFAYYRRVIENQKNRMLDQVLKVSRKLNASEELIEQIESAITETQFSKAVDSIKTTLPQTLLINGNNPLKLLHSALSDGLHDRTDEHCLELASSIRIVLNEFSERMAQALKDEQELNTALSKIMHLKSGE